MSPFKLFKADVVVSPNCVLTFSQFSQTQITKKEPLVKNDEKHPIRSQLIWCNNSKSIHFGPESCLDAG